MPVKRQRELLTTAQVAELAGITRSHVAQWARLRGISRVRPDGECGYYYPAGAVGAACTHKARIPAGLRLRRWVAKALIA